MARVLEHHHKAWLSAHPNRSEQWLFERLRDGFDIHHVDGNHANNDPLNLVLIEAHDHMRLHGAKSLLRDVNAARRREDLKPKVIQAYDSYASAPAGCTTWGAVAKRVDWPLGNWKQMLAMVSELARVEGRKWPIHDRATVSRVRNRNRFFANALGGDENFSEYQKSPA